ncbi:uncharacterized protein [Battus philenor]|uniref:uncharacterized protein n=1 Tax=Battus philenor TaxID=42288 RepID=UPI0035D04CE8
MSYEFVGEIETITERQIEFVSEVLKKHKCTGSIVTVEAVGKKGDNYGAYVKRIKVEQEDGNEFKMIAKIAPANMILREQRPVNDFFANETLIYNELLPMFRKLQENFGVPDNDKFKFPICYGTLDEPINEIILLEDLEPYNYVMLNKTEPLSDEIVKTVLKNLANFHSLSYVLRNKEPQVFDKFMGTLVNASVNPKTMAQTQMFFEHALNDLKSIFDKDRYKNTIDYVMQHLVKTWMKLVSADKGSKYSVIQHGDLWTNNIMFQMQDGHPSGCILIDYQLSRDSVPVADIHNLIFSCTDYATRSRHYYEWIDFYHSELDRYLQYYDLKVNYVYPRDKFDADLKRYGKPALGLALIMLNFTQRPVQEVPDLAAFEKIDGTNLPDSFKVGQLMDKTVGVIKERIEGVIDSCFEYGYLADTTQTNFM